MKYKTDFLIVGAGIIGLTIAKNIREKFPNKSIIIIEKENDIAKHSSGRNSGVLHAGFYYTEDSLKAKFTKDGNFFWRDYCKLKKIRINNCGKVIVSRDKNDLDILEKLLNRGKNLGIELYKIDEKELEKIEPEARTFKYALWSPNTATVNPMKVCYSILNDLKKEKVKVLFGTPYIKKLSDNSVKAGNFKIEFDYLINCAGLYADKIAKDFNTGKEFTIIPFKGLYLISDYKFHNIKTNIYPVPDINKPFLGVHFTLTVDNEVKLGPTAIPAFWREHYKGLENFSLYEFISIIYWELYLLITNKFGFRNLALEEIKKYNRKYFINLARYLVKKDFNFNTFNKWGRAGIRAQLLNKKSGKLEMDFIIRTTNNSLHILNSVSPAFTASYPFTKWIVNKYL